MDYGFEAAGFRTAACVEMDRDACETIRNNRPAWSLISSDVADVTSRDLLKAAKAKAGDVDVIIGGPPCQPFSTAAYWHSRGRSPRLRDPRANTIEHYLRLVAEIRPRVIVMENVPAFSFKGKRDGLDFVERRLREINAERGTRYEPATQILNATDHGVPQVRRRFFLVASRDGTTYRFPQANAEEATRTAWDAIGNLVPRDDENLETGGFWSDLLPSIPEGKNYLHHTRKGDSSLFGYRTRYWSFLLKLAKDLPAWTISAQPGSAAGPFHWDNRRLSHDELARLQTFPHDIRVSGGRTAVQRQIGNAVPSLLAEVIAREIRTQLLDGKRYHKQPVLAVAKRSDCPSKKRASPVHAKYKHLQHEYADHPGPSRGPGALEDVANAAE